MRMRTAGKACELQNLTTWNSTTGMKALELKMYATGDWNGLIWLRPRPLRPQCFLDIQSELTDREYWRLLAEVWIDAEGVGYNRLAWLRLFSSSRSHKHELMTPEEHAVFDALPEQVRVYRGAPLKHARGMSWTTALEVAERFARTSSSDGMVHTTTIPKAKAIAYLDGRKESEIVLDPRRIRIETSGATISPQQ